MTEVSSKDIHKIYFLRLQEKLPRWYFFLATHFSQSGIALVPITWSDLKEIGDRSNKIFIISAVTNLSSQALFNKILYRGLNFLIVKKQAHLYHMTSFNMISKYMGTLDKNYHFIKLPESMKLILKNIMDHYKTENIVDNRWPGKKSNSLPKVLGF